MARLPRVPRALALALCVLSAALASSAAPIARRSIAPPLGTATVGVVAAGCDGAPAAPACPAGRQIRVAALTFGTAATACGGPLAPPRPPRPPCALSAHDQAAATALAAQRCDGLQACSVAPADLVRLFGDPCAGVGKALAVSYACLDAVLDPPAPATLPPPGDLYLRRPSAFAAPKCPAYAAGVAAASDAGIFWSSVVAGSASVVRVSAVYVDLNATDLPGLVQAATKGAFSLDDVAELNVTAVNFQVLPGALVSIGRNNPGLTRVRIRAVNVIASGTGELDVRSNGPDAAGNFGPDVEVVAANIYGALKIRQNGLTALNPLVSTNQYAASLQMWENENDPVTYYSACSTTTFNAESVNGGVLIPPICSAGSGPDPTQFQPFCATSPQTTCTTFWTDANQPGLTFCARWSVNIAASVYYGTPMLGAGQNDSWSYFGVKTDRFTWPQYTGFASGNDPNPPTLPAKAAPHGRVTTSALNFLGADADPASAVGSATWGANPAGVFSTADYSIALDAFPSQEYLYRLLGQGQIPSNLSYAGFLEVSARWQDNPPSSGIGTDWSAAMDAACPSNNEPFSVLQGTISHTPSQTSPSSFPGLDPTVARLALNCLDEMVASSRFPDAQAFAADLAPAFGPGSGTSRGLAASLARIVSRASELRTDRTSPAVRTVPFLSGATIADQAGGVLDALVASEAALDALMQQGAGYSTAVAGVQGTLAMLDAQVQGDGAAMQADEEFMRSIAAVAARLNETYVEAIAKSNATLKVFEAGVRKKISEEVGEAVFQFFASAVAVVLGDVGAIAGMAAAAEGALGQAVKDVEKIASFLSNLGNLVNSIFTLINNIITFVNQLQNTPNQPNISVTPQLSASFQNNTQALVSLSVATLNFKDLHDEVFIALSPAIAMGIDGSTDYAEALAHVANTGFDWSQAQIQLLSAQNKYVQDGLKLQAAQAQRDKVALVVQRLQDVENSLDLPAAVTEGYLDLLDGKMRALELFGQACDAYSFAYTAECPLRASGMAPNPTSPAAVFKAAVQGSLASLDDVFHGSSCFCNASFVVTDPGFIGNLTGGNGTAVLDLSDPTNQQLYNFFGPFDDVHVYQLNLKPYGIVPINPPPGTAPTLTLDVRPVGLFTNTFSYSGGWYERQFLARPYGITVQLEPTNDWTVTVPGSLSGLEAGKVYAPSPYARWSIRESGEDLVRWDWSGVWGVQVEMWGKHARRHSLSKPAATPLSALQYCTCPGS